MATETATSNTGISIISKMNVKIQNGRTDCTKCQRPQRVCICAALPLVPLSLGHCHCLILQHPHELRRKNRSLPFVELCLAKESYTRVTCRRFFSTFQHISSGSSSGANNGVIKDGASSSTHEEDVVRAMHMFNDSTNPVWLVYPHPEAISLDEALEELRRDCNTSTSQQQQGDVVVTLVFLDATWKFAKEMDQANKDHYPRHNHHHNFKRVQLSAATDLKELLFHSGRSKAKRFDIRTPPSADHLSTAECLAWIVSKIEQEPEIYETLMKPLDLAVEQWHSFRLGKT